MVVLEDLQWADASTLAVVEYLADNIGAAPVLVVLTVRSDEESAASGLVRRLADRRSATSLEI